MVNWWDRKVEPTHRDIEEAYRQMKRKVTKLEKENEMLYRALNTLGEDKKKEIKQ